MKDSHLHPSARTVVYGQNGMVATSHYLAAQAGRDILRQSGNAVDAAIAAAAALTVVEPTSNGLGGDCFAIIHHEGQLHGLNASGYAPKRLTLKALREKNGGTIRPHGFESVTVPGQIAGWHTLWERFGKLDFKDLMTPAIDLAEHGFPVTPTVARHWKRAAEVYEKRLDRPCHKAWFDTFTHKGESPAEGSIKTLKDHARTLRAIAETKGRSFYEGNLADRIVAHSDEHGGFISHDDLSSFKPRWVSPVGMTYRGHTVYELPPNCQGGVTSMALNVLNHLPEDDDPDLRLHHQIEAIKIAFADASEHFADPDHMVISLSELLKDVHGEKRAREITGRAQTYSASKPTKSGTVFLTSADEDGMMVSFIQSNYMGFGSGIVIPGTGIALNNRGMNFSTDPRHVNCVGPRKRPYHTIMPGFLYQGETPLGPFGVMGGFMQPQGHLQVLSHLIDLGMDPQQALDAPRWFWKEENTVEVERDFPVDAITRLRRRGHTVEPTDRTALFGRGQIILRHPDTGVYAGGTDKRADGAVAVP